MFWSLDLYFFSLSSCNMYGSKWFRYIMFMSYFWCSLLFLINLLTPDFFSYFACTANIYVQSKCKVLNFPLFFLLSFLIDFLVFTLFTPFYNSFYLRLTTPKCRTISSYVKTKTISRKNKKDISVHGMHNENCNDVQYVNCIGQKRPI